jgi:flagellar assembly protein FliH
MNSQSESRTKVSDAVRRLLPAGTPLADAATGLIRRECVIAPFEFRALTGAGIQVLDRDLRSSNRHDDTVEYAANASRGTWHALGESVTELENSCKRARKEGFDEGEIRGRKDAHVELEKEFRESIERERQHIKQVISEFSAVQEQYFADVEREVVNLALAIAARVLHRESTIDPLLLSGAVRVAMEKMADRSGLILRVSTGDGPAWVQLCQSMEPSERPGVIEDARLRRGECLLTTNVGTVELGVGVQLEEIEKGFFDLLSHRPGQ